MCFTDRHLPICETKQTLRLAAIARRATAADLCVSVVKFFCLKRIHILNRVVRTMASKPPDILVVDDDSAHRTMLRTLLSGWGYTVTEADDGAAALAAVEEKPFDLVLMDIRMVTVSGIEALDGIKQRNPAIPVVMMTAYSSVDTAVEALKKGAYDYLTKPFDFEKLKVTISRALEHTQLKEENRRLREDLARHFDRQQIIGRSPVMERLLDTVAQVATSEATVLLTGESGTGKELIAEAVHFNSRRKNGPFIKINCAAITETLLESELFGHEKGAFTGADRRKEGRFQQADGGSIFLDEVSEMSLGMQVKLLRVIQEGRSPVSAAAKRFPSTFGSSRQPTDIFGDSFKTAGSGKISITV